jgi:hypothetical protein
LVMQFFFSDLVHPPPPPPAVQGFLGQDSGRKKQDHRGKQTVSVLLATQFRGSVLLQDLQEKPVCLEPECKEQHIKWLHNVFKELPCLKGGEECKVNLVQGEDGWRTPEDAWMRYSL